MLSDIEEVYSLKQINVQKNLYKKWNLASGTTITAVHPPLESIKIIVPDGEVLATTFKTGHDGLVFPLEF